MNPKRAATMIHASYDVIVLGLGAMGSSAAYELARRCRRVLGLEQFNLGHDRGSSHGQTRIIRKAYFEHPDYVPLLHRAFERWYELEQLRAEHLFTECGCLNIGQPGGELIDGVRASARQHQLATDELTAAELRKSFPQFRYGDDYVGVLEREAGFLYVEKCVKAYQEEAAALGAQLREHEPAVSWQVNGKGVVVQTRSHQFAADRLVITAGAWAAPVLAELKLPLTVRRKVLLWFATSDERKYRRDVFPIYLSELPGGKYFYGFPVIDRQGHKVARHDGGDAVADPAKVNRAVTLEDEKCLRDFLDEYLPGVNGPMNAGRVCLYTLTPDQHFIIDRHPQHEQVVIAAGFSGHGFKFASVVGEILADLSDKGASDLPIQMFRLNRWSSGAART
ncbi:MAG: N-methyl-L-tryptophan oxidase [Gemmataceae bacterium]